MDGYQLATFGNTPDVPVIAPRPARKALLVLGMSRSGTSALTHLLHAKGAALPDRVLGAGHGNPLGHFEPSDLVALNDEILAAFGRSWHDPRPLPPRWPQSNQAHDFLQRIVGAISANYAGRPLFVLKDPRICRLLPLYLQALDILDIEPLIVLQVRPVLQVTRSLADRDGLNPALTEHLWLRSIIDAEWHSRTCRRVWVSMAQLFADWPGTAERIAAALDLQWPVEPSAPAGSILKPRFYHREITQDAPATHLSALVWASIELGLAGHDAMAQLRFDEARATMADFDTLNRATQERFAPPKHPLLRALYTWVHPRHHSRLFSWAGGSACGGGGAARGGGGRNS